MIQYIKDLLFIYWYINESKDGVFRSTDDLSRHVFANRIANNASTLLAMHYLRKHHFFGGEGWDDILTISVKALKSGHPMLFLRIVSAARHVRKHYSVLKKMSF